MGIEPSPSRKFAAMRPLENSELWVNDETLSWMTTEDARELLKKAAAKQNEFLQAPFSQKDYLRKLSSEMREKREGKNSIIEGICLGGSLTWIALRQHAPDASPQQTLKAIEDPDNPVALAAQVECKEFEITELQTLPQNERVLAESSFVSWDDRRLKGLAKTILENNGAGVLLKHRAGEPERDFPHTYNNHGTAFYNPGDGQNVEFFDSNRGIFSIPRDHLEEFLLAHRERYRTGEFLAQPSVLWPTPPPMNVLVESPADKQNLPRVQIDNEAISPDIKLWFDVHTAPDDDSRNAAAAVKDFVIWTNRLYGINVKRAPYFDTKLLPLPRKKYKDLLHIDWDRAVEVLSNCANSLKTSKDALDTLGSQLSSQGNVPRTGEKREVLGRLIERRELEKPARVEQKINEVGLTLLKALSKTEGKVEVELKSVFLTKKDRGALELVRESCQHLTRRVHESLDLLTIAA